MDLKDHNLLHFGNKKCKKEAIICQKKVLKLSARIMNFLKHSSIISIIMIDRFHIINIYIHHLMGAFMSEPVQNKNPTAGSYR